MKRRMFIIAGPNGAGKTTIAESLVPNIKLIYEYINADEIAKGLAPLHPESVALAASKLMIKRLRDLLDANKNIAFETTASGTNYLKYIKDAQAKEYEVHLTFLWLSSPELAVNRVARRVAQGGHNIAEETIKRRYFAGLENLLNRYLPLADSALIIDNSIAEPNSYKIIALKEPKYPIKIINSQTWEIMNRSIK